ncbi:Cytochrome P450 [Mycena venus]|uniref:Cytochrome P450 n=1 Tax=Mycena venus TaxID=2733690 RepID=A0A8H6YLE5_9AGAR|nr:Cytochrome P450 [Mycena venus]
MVSMYKTWFNGYVGDGLDSATERLGLTFKTRFFGVDKVWTSNVEIIHQILVKDFNGYVKGDEFRTASAGLLGHAIFTTDDKSWSITRPFFRRSRVSDFEHLEQLTNTAIAIIKEKEREGRAFDFQDLISRLSIDASTLLLFGTCLDSLREGSSGYRVSGQANSFRAAVIRSLHTICGRLMIGPSWPVLEIFGDSTASDNALVDSFIDPLLDASLAKKAAGGTTTNYDSSEPDTLLDSLLSEISDRKVLRDETVVGGETTASSLSFVIYCLTQHPQVKERLRAEILEMLGHDRTPDAENIKSLKFLRAVIDETLRLYPTIPYNLRETTRDTTWPPNKAGEKPYFIPAKTSVCYSVWLLHRNVDLWGPDAMTEGPRNCLGLQFAYLQMSFVLIKLLQTFETFTLATEAQPSWSRPPASWRAPEFSDHRKFKEECWPRTHIALYPNGGMWVRMKEEKVL